MLSIATLGVYSRLVKDICLPQANGPLSADEDALMELQVIVGLSLYSKGQFDRAVATLEPLAGAWRDKSLYWKKCLRGFNKSNRRCTVLLMLRCKFCNPLFVHIPQSTQLL